MTFDELMGEVGKALNIELVTHDGATQLEVDGMAVSILEMPALDAVVLNGVIGEPPPQGLEPLHKAMLEANYNFAGTAGATLAVNPEDGTLTLTRLVPSVRLDTDSLLAALESFVNVLEAWRKILVDYRPDESGAASAPADAVAPQIGDGFLQV